MILLPPLLVTLLTCYFVGRLCMHEDSPLYLPDVPNGRSLHQKTCSRSGGAALCLAILGGTVVAAACQLLPWFIAVTMLGALGIAAISFLDDAIEIFCGYRFAVHIYAACILFTIPIIPAAGTLPGLAVPLTSSVAVLLLGVSVVWMVNLYNFMDGMDGFAAGMGAIGFSTLAAVGFVDARIDYAMVNLIVGVACFVFLRFNSPPARLFMGDTGACLLGYLAAVSALWGERSAVLPLWTFLLIFSPFIVDATVTLTGRLIRLEKVWIGQRNHFYHKLLLRLGHTRTVRGYYTVMVACAVTAIATRNASVAIQWVAIASWSAFYVGAMIAIQRFTARHRILAVMER